MADRQNPSDRISPVIATAVQAAMDQSDLSRLIVTAKSNLCNGVFSEPRWYFDEIVVPGNQTIGFSNPDAFKNGEAFPVKITHVLLSTRSRNDVGTTIDERFIQRIGVKLVFHGQEYMAGREFAAAPLWLNKVVAAPNSISFGQASHHFFDPWLLTARDTMRVQVALTEAATTSRNAQVSFSGFGLDSRRPYWKSADVDIAAADGTTIQALNSALYRNDGDEPIVMTDMSVTLGADDADNNPQGDVSLLRVQVNQVGNGTQSEWFKHASSGAPSNLMLAQQLGTMSGRIVVHELDSPIYFEPGEGLNVQTQLLVSLPANLVLAVALAGTILIT